MQIMAEIRDSKKNQKKLKFLLTTIYWSGIISLVLSRAQHRITKKRHAGVLELADRLD